MCISIKFKFVARRKLAYVGRNWKSVTKCISSGLIQFQFILSWDRSGSGHENCIVDRLWIYGVYCILEPATSGTAVSTGTTTAWPGNTCARYASRSTWVSEAWRGMVLVGAVLNNPACRTKTNHETETSNSLLATRIDRPWTSVIATRACEQCHS